MVKAIQTKYNGFNFRSRLEARWARFFDLVGIKYEYELEGFEIPKPGGEGHWKYLPDFFLPQTETWVEVKGSLSDVTDDYLEMLAMALDFQGYLPGVHESIGSGRGLLWLGPIPTEFRYGYSPAHLILQHHEGGWIGGAHFAPDLRVHSLRHEIDEHFQAYCGDAHEIIRDALADTYNGGRSVEAECPTPVREAYRGARSVRFEFGETPRGPRR